MRQVTKEEFYRKVGPLNVHPSPTGSYPYTSEWKYLDYSKHGQLFGKSVGRQDGGNTVTDYYIAGEA